MAKLGHEAPHFDYAAPPETDQLSIELQPPSETKNVEPVAPNETPTVKTDTPKDYEARIPAPAQAELEDARRLFDTRDTNYPMTSAQIREGIGGSMLTGDDIERQELRQVKLKPSKRPRKDRRHLSARGKLTADEPSAHQRQENARIRESEPLTEKEKEEGRAQAEAAKRILGF